MSRMIFVNLPVSDVSRSMAFFTTLGFTFNEKYTNEKAACMVITETIYVMLLREAFFQTFTNKAVSDATLSTEVLTCISCESRDEVDALVEKALAAGASLPAPAQDHGFMYSRFFSDLDGHIWEFIWMDPAMDSQ